jgi:hypothetical protein
MKRLIPVLIGLVVVIGGGLILLTVVHGRDAAGIDGNGSASGGATQEPDEGDVERKGAGVGRFSQPAPTSGPHQRSTPEREGRIDDATLLTALALGDVAFVYGGSRPPAALKALQEQIAGPFDPELAAAGQSILLVRRDGTTGVQALAWRQRLSASGPSDDQLRAFAESWLGRGAEAG